ncbi:hypothetical protein GCM10009104_18540 [Marinobacterium maritimum]|uniref:O-antigen ligase-related domain-containing protein n=1 Tax=Marinobacterium maritimum TaxID=500162 RepID=A0ABP3T997_9GAMM
MSQHRSPLESALIVMTLGLLVWLPLPKGSYAHWSGSLFSLITATLTLLWAWQQLNKNSSHNRALGVARTPFLLLLGAQLWVLLQLLFGITTDQGETLYYLTLGLGYSFLFILVIGLFYTRSRLTLLLSTLVVSATFQAFYGTFMTLSGVEWLLFEPKAGGQGVVSGTYFNRNHLAGYLVMSLGCGIGLLMALRDGAPFRWHSLLEMMMGPKARLRLALVIMVIALVMTRSRMGNTAFFASLLIIGGLFVLLNREHRLRNSLILASLILIDVLVISQFFGLDKLKDRLVGTRFQDEVVVTELTESAREEIQREEPSSQTTETAKNSTVADSGSTQSAVVEETPVVIERLTLSQEAEARYQVEVVERKNVIRTDVFGYVWQQFTDRPLVGFGAGSFGASFQPYAGEDIRGFFNNAHNDYLQFAVEYGLIGFTALGAFVLICLYHALKALWHRQSWYRSGVGFGAAMGILGILIHSATDFNLQIPANAATFVTLCAIGILANQHRKTRRRN